MVAVDGLTLMYHGASGMTHIMATPAPEILAALTGEACTRAALMQRLKNRYDLAEADEAALAARLDELVSAGLVEAL
ncbi:MAG: HPr-rel-A system PqqD family peptide chaperone [Sphingomonas sp.]|nr:HPr-rel-A system PqqD family peptide chaperone [Sphingomonas sp.]